MSVSMVFGLLGGLALFLYGMQMMSVNLEAAAGSRMKHILERLTANRFLGVCVGAGITAVIQSSSATTVMVVGFVNSGLMTLKQAVWIIMGANIGTTVTGQLIALDIGELAPFITFVGVALILFVKRKHVQFAGGIIAGLGILFIGMGMMGGGYGSSAGIGGLCQSHDKILESASGHFGRRCIYSHHSVLVGFCGYPAGFGCQRPDWSGQRGVCAVRAEYRNLHYGGACFHWSEP